MRGSLTTMFSSVDNFKQRIRLYTMKTINMSKLSFSSFSVLILLQCEAITSLNCGDIKAQDSPAKFTVEELKTLKGPDVADCFPIFGKDKLSMDKAEIIWQHILKIHDSADQIPEEDLRLLGWVAKGIPKEHFQNMSFTDIDTIAAFGRYYELSNDQLSGLRNAVMEQWSYKDIQDLSHFDLANLGHILCAFNESDISQIRPDAYKDAASELSMLKNCTPGVLKELSKLATNPHGFGEPSTWTALQVSSIGCVIAGVPSIASIPSEAFRGLTPDIVDCLPKTFFQSMSVDQLSELPATSSQAVSQIGLTGAQAAALQLTITGPASSSSAPVECVPTANKTKFFFFLIICLTYACLSMHFGSLF